MKYIKTYENKNPKINDEVICINTEDCDDILNYAKTYVIKNITGDQFLLFDVPYYWYADRFKLRKELSEEEINFYDDIIIKQEMDHFNI